MCCMREGPGPSKCGLNISSQGVFQVAKFMLCLMM